ncbi:Uma2 family endonuclease [Sodalinema gerasimenkoae]|uniref:Uma2 family endonuclease n=1 Tax=Sodalinema gerasimenkoae TaxID=2862348 RepID=UPI0013574C03|nr:Uma2 family endonuclease [Sodalinema gerasimenkoae]
MTTLRIQTETAPVIVSFPTLAPMSREEFLSFCQANGQLRIERAVTGEVEIMPPAFSDTGNRNFNLAVQLGIWTEEDGTGLGFDSSAGFTLPNGAMRSPDASWVKRAKWNQLSEEEKASFAPICPDFVVELRSKSDALATLQAKMQDYIDNGASLAWLIDRPQRRVCIYRPQQAPQCLENLAEVSGEPELPGFTLTMATIWYSNRRLPD